MIDKKRSTKNKALDRKAALLTLRKRREKNQQAQKLSSERATKLTELVIREGAKQFGESTFVSADDMLGNIKGYVSTSIPPLDVLLTGEVGKGFVYGRVAELIGEADVGKTTLGCYVMRNVQREGGIAVLIDTERTLTRKRLSDLGVNTSSGLVVIQDNILEDIATRIEFVLDKIGQTPAVIFWDTVASTLTRAASSKRIGESMKIGEHAKLLADMFRKITTPLAESSAALILCNQRKTGGIGQMFINQRQLDATLGGDAAKFHSVHRLKLSFLNAKKNKESKERSQSFVVTANNVKNKVSNSRLQGRFVISLTGDVSEFDIPQSFVTTMQAWSVFSSGRHLCKVAGKGITAQQFAKLYGKDKAFTTDMDRRLVAAYNDLNLRGMSGALSED